MPTPRVGDPMERRVAEIIVRLAESTVAVAHVEAGASYRVGRMRGVDLALDVPTFYLVSSTTTGFVVRRDADSPGELLDGPVELAFAAVTIIISLATLSTAPLARRGVERRPWLFGTGSIAAHAILLTLAWWIADPQETSVTGAREAKARPTRIARFAAEAQTVERKAEAPPTDIPITADDTPSTMPTIEPDVAETGDSEASLATPDGEGEVVDRTIESRELEGRDTDTGERRFDPDANPAFDSVKVGHYSTVATGKGAGEQYELAGANGNRKPLIVVSCDASTCIVMGGKAGSTVREELEKRLPQIIACYQDHASTAGKKVELDFGINATGKVETDTVNVGGVGDYDSCVADIINKIQFGESTESTGSADT